VTSREFRDRVLKRAKKADVQVAAPVLEQLEAYYRLLSKWNDKINLTALPLRELTDQAVDRLLIEPLAAARYLPEGRIVWFDLGSGGGSPALPLKAVRPSAHLTLVESRTRKAAFLREAVRSLAMSDVVVESVRFEELLARRPLRQTAQLVTVRAVKLDKAFFDVARALLTPSGLLFLFSSFEMSPRTAAGFVTARTVRLAPDARVGSLPSSQLVILRRT
jgi:16S rRNA (guanine527-N7)-methyltransferase